MPRLLLLLTFTLASTAAAQVGSSTSFGPQDWPALERIAKKVPSFAGFTIGYENKKAVARLALTDLKQEGTLRAALNADGYWNERMSGWSIGAGAVQMKTPMSRLLEVVRKVKAERPNATLRIDTAFGKVRLNAPSTYTRTLAAKLGVGDLLVDNAWQPLATFKYDVQPRTVSLKYVSGDPHHAVPDLRVIVKNVGDEPAELPLYCSTLPVHVITAKGGMTPPVNLFCADIRQTRLMQAGETVSFDSFLFSNIKKLKPGQYAWVLGKEKFPFVLTK